jgi:hypothetical protein
MPRFRIWNWLYEGLMVSVTRLKSRIGRYAGANRKTDGFFCTSSYSKKLDFIKFNFDGRYFWLMVVRYTFPLVPITP